MIERACSERGVENLAICRDSVFAEGEIMRRVTLFLVSALLRGSINAQDLKTISVATDEWADCTQ